MKADLGNLKEYSYPERVSISERLDKNKALNIIKGLVKDKAPGLNRIPNKILKRITSVAPILITGIF